MKHDRVERTLIIIIIILLTSVVTAQIVRREDHARFSELDYTLTEIEQQNEDLSRQMRYLREELEQWNTGEFEASAYAPLDPKAIEGICYSGDPRVTATGAKTTPGQTIAVDPKVIPR